MSMRTLAMMNLAARTYPPKATGSTEWTRPADWLPMPTTAANQIDVLAAVFDHESNYCALHVHVATGTWDIDWGDGTIETGLVSGTKRDHLYDYADPQLDGTLTTRGYKQAMIKITPSAGAGAITRLDFADKNTTVALANGVTNPWLDVQVNTPGLTALDNAFYTAGATSRMLERVNFISLGAVTTLSLAFQNCSSLQAIIFPTGSLAAVTTLASVFSNCSSLRSIVFPAGSLAAVTTITYAFSGCSALQAIAFPAGSLTLVTNLAYAFSGCSALQSIAFPVGSLAAVTTLAGAFNGCSSLQSIVLPAGSLSLVTTLYFVFSNCSSLRSIVFPAGSLAAVTTITYAFSGCFALQSITFPAGSLSLVTDTTSVVASNYNLANITNCLIPVTFSVASLKLSGAALDEIYTALPTVVGQTITVTGNFGTATHTPSIATAKGWTVTV